MSVATSAPTTAKPCSWIFTILRAEALVAELVPVLQRSGEADALLAAELLNGWDRRADVDAAAPCLIYPFMDRFWPRRLHALGAR